MSIRSYSGPDIASDNVPARERTGSGRSHDRAIRKDMAALPFLPMVGIRLKCRKPRHYPEDPKTLGEQITKRRMEFGLTQRQAAKALRINPWTVLHWETGQYQPPIRSIPSILAFVGYDPLADSFVDRAPQSPAAVKLT
jgi:DNA-binding XRE family transcriptional regulator